MKAPSTTKATKFTKLLSNNQTNNKIIMTNYFTVHYLTTHERR